MFSRPSSGIATAALLSALACGEAPGDRPAASAASAASAAPAAPIRVTDGADRIVTLAQPARRIIALMPSVTEWVIALGAADRLVARTDYDTQPELDTLPSVGGGLTPSIEWMASREPDLVVAWPDAPSRSVAGRLAALDVAVYAAPSETIEDALGVAADLGALLGLASVADSAIGEVTAGLDSVRAAVADRPRQDVLYLIGLDPLMAAGPGTFIDQLVGIAGGRNVLEELGALWPQISLEEVIRRAPDVVIVGSASIDDPLALLRARPGWRDLAAVRQGRVHAVDPSEINRPGPGLDESAAALARLIHPGGRSR